MFGTTQVKNCNWIGGVDLNLPQRSNGNNPREQRGQRVTVLLSLNRRIQVVRIGEEAGAVKVGYFTETPRKLLLLLPGIRALMITLSIEHRLCRQHYIL